MHFNGSPANESAVGQMLAQIRHRGPDASALFVDGPVALGHARLSIIDLEGGRQPMQTADGQLCVTFNGEIYNYVELREELQAKGHRFATRSDTEVILHAYEQYGADCVRRFNGQWAFALWDRRRQTLFLSRDRCGVRPVYFTRAGEKFLFASEIKALFAHGDVRRELDPGGLDQLFTFWATLPPATVFRGVQELPPGCNLTLRDGQWRVESYWRWEYAPEAAGRSEAECAEQLLELLADATRLRLRADVPVGAYLSGGLDSTVTAALAQRFTGDRLRTFSVAFEDAEFDESRYQQAAVKHLGVDHQTVMCRKTDIGRVFPEVIWHAERPVLRAAPAPMYLLSRLVREQGYKVVVTGEGADEVLGGYDLFKEAKVRRFWAAAPDSAFRAGALARLYPYLTNLQAQPLAYRKAFFHARPEDLAHPLFSHLPRWDLTARLKVFFSPAMQAELAGASAYADCLGLLPADFERWPPFCRAQHLEASILLPGYILSAQSDRMAMAHSVEGRFPFLDHRLAEFAAGLPCAMKMRGLDEKHLLKRAARGLIPASVFNRSKQPYRAPDAECFFAAGAAGDAGEYVAELLAPQRIAADGVFQPAAVELLVRKARAGRAIGVKDNMALLGVLSTQLVVDQFIRNFRPRSAPKLSHVETVPFRS